MTREDKDSLVEMLAKIPITETRGSLLSAIGKLLRVIDISESSIMIPTLLKDKCEFDAYEMLTLAKILKASILGHNDLVEFYMSESSSQLNSLAVQQQQQQHQHQLQSTTSSSLRSSSESSTQSSSIPSTPTIPTSSSAATNSAESLMITSSSHSSSSQCLSNKQLQLHHSPNQQLHHHHHHHHHLHDRRQQQLLQLQQSNGDPDATLRLLLQIEQLKTFIPQVTGLFESIIELYKNSVDTITYQTSRTTHK